MMNGAPPTSRLNRYRLLAVAIIALFVVSAIPVQQAHAQTPYTEKLNVYIAGSDALWFVTFGGINGSSHLSALESTPGLSWYNVTAIDTSGWESDFQVFGAEGYNLLQQFLPVDYIPPQAMFLTVGSNSYTNASAAATALDSYLLTDFVSLSNGTGTYSFYSPVTFTSLVPATLLRFIPTSEGGFASAITSSTFSTSDSPFVALEGVKSSSGFDHSLVVGSITTSALDTSDRPSILSYFGSGVTSLKASKDSSSSMIQINTLGGIMSSSDKATVVNNNNNYTGSYTLKLATGQNVTQINATVVQQAAPLLATRAIDFGVLHTDGDLAVTLTFKDLSTSETISNLTFSDDWWNGTGDFKFLGGTYSVSNDSLSPGGSTTPVYRLEYIGNVTGAVTIPASVVSYHYQERGATFNATTVMNPIRLSLGADDAVVYAILTPVGSLGKVVGASQSMNVTVVNVGTLPASSVVVAGQSVPGLAAGGGTATVTVTQSAQGLAGINVTRYYQVTYENPSGATLNATSNEVSDVFSQTSMKISFPVVSVETSVVPLSDHSTNITLTFVISDLAPANVSSFEATGTLPSSLGCGKVTGNGIACSNDQLTISYATLNASATVRSSMSYDLTNGSNYILAPFDFNGVSGGANLTGESNPVPVPGGLKLSKQFSPDQLFSGMNSEVTVEGANLGPTPFYNVSLKATVDSFDSVTNQSALSRTSASIAQGANMTFSYNASVSPVYGNLTGTALVATFYFGGTSFSIQGGRPYVDIYQPLSVTITPTPSLPEEGKSFTISFQITNPSGVQVSNVSFTLPIPAGLKLSDLRNIQATSKSITFTVSSLGPHGTANGSATAIASSGISVPFADAKLTFVYEGVTIKGTVPSSSGIALAEDVLTRYIIPTALVLVVALGVAYYVRKKAATVPSSQK